MNPFLRRSAALVLLALVASLLAYQWRAPMFIQVGDDDGTHRAGFFDRESDGTHAYRWTNDGHGQVTFFDPGVATPLTVVISAAAWRTEDRIFPVTVTANGHAIGTMTRAQWRTWTFTISDPSILRADQLTIGLNSESFAYEDVWSGTDDRRRLGAQVESVRIEPEWKFAGDWRQWLTIPPPLAILFTILFALGILLFARALGVSERVSLGAAILSILLNAVLIAFFRIWASERILLVILATGIGALALVLSTHRKPRMALGLFVVLVVFIAILARYHASNIYSVEGDEATYLDVATHYAQAIQSFDWGEIVTYDHQMGHPIFFELVYAMGFVIRNALGISISDISLMRGLATLLGAAQVGLLALLNPVAAWLLALQTTELKFTSMAYLEAMPALTSAIAVIAYEQFRRTQSKRWFYFSALALGATGASKFIYFGAGLAIFLFLFWEQRRQPKNILIYVAIAGAIFLALDPYLWSDPVGRFSEMFLFQSFQTTNPGDYFRSVNRPWWYLFAILTQPGRIYLPSYAYPPPYFVVPDAIILALGILGVLSLWRRAKIYVAWFVLGVLFLAVYPVKWEQYSMIIITPLCLSAGAIIVDALERLKNRWVARSVLEGNHVG